VKHISTVPAAEGQVSLRLTQLNYEGQKTTLCSNASSRGASSSFCVVLQCVAFPAACYTAKPDLSQGCSLKGRPKTCDITDKIASFFDKTFEHAREPLYLRFLVPTMHAGSPIALFSVNYEKGASRAIAAHIIAQVATTSGIGVNDWDEESKQCLYSLVYITCFYKPVPNEAELTFTVCNLKQRAAETQRMDILQLINTFATQYLHDALMTTSELKDKLVNTIAIYNKRTTQVNCKIEGQERMALINLVVWGQGCQAVVAACWNAYKIRESAMTVSVLCHDYLKKRVPEQTAPNWAAWMKPEPAKMQTLLTRLCTTYTVKQQLHASSGGRRSSAASFKEKVDDDLLWMCMCWHAWQESEEIKGCVSQKQLQDVNGMFFRGTLDEQVLSCLRRNDPNFKAQ
jgi:uncharacterized Zn ribbon protein